MAYHVVDVFVVDGQPFTGNPLAVVLDGERLNALQMQALAREFALSETAFPLPAEAADADYRLRIFTPEEELPFAGHPSVGSAWLLSALGRLPARSAVRQECGAGVLPVRFLAGGQVEVTGGAPVAGPPVDPAALVEACGLTVDDVVQWPARLCGTGVSYFVLAVAPRALDAAAADLARLRALPAPVFLLSWSAGTVHARMFAPGLGVPEDPATGSAVTALGAWLAANELIPADGEVGFEVRQGTQIGRPSLLQGRVVTSGGRAVECAVAGAVAAVARGQVVVPLQAARRN
ncbi:MAG: PhzF family phenazine biosynthesis protein [Frankiaceae bacterium]